ncbi:RagB/SusD family nutrient uptake outer membrane protein [Segetibacter sp. 3557_3]|uniref:RagB/SusD family nutrient uptake outer membrane protein n=1 Tax=Segetibacter sp. 3557_3 TaxID=2547429 RepID=UPI001058AC49|nr:RagB/SusD family nutrient uptake outer membrane protein [Segetibacter sp. 3557_3]TDH27767.1 RagB/SusD family nutrient uptake outer membrane protein [Segetibacter sp. 3557_3]
MKRTAYLVLTIVTTLTISCKKILQPDTPSSFNQEYIFSTEADAKKAVNAVYALFNGDPFTSRVSTNYAGNTDVEVGGTAAAPDGGRRDIWSFEATSSNSEILSVWNNAYNAINKANECIEGLQSSSIAGEKGMKQLIGEAKTLRAYWYYLLVNNWGDVPFQVTATRAGDNYYLPKTGRDTILSYLIHDLVVAEPDMMWADQLDFGTERINREFVMGMIARLSLMRGGYWLYPDMSMQRKADFRSYYDTANLYCKKLVQLKPHQLSPFDKVFENINKSVKVNNDDVLYEVAFAPGAGDVGWNIGVSVAAGTHNYGSTTIAMLLTPTYYHSFDTTDLRLNTTCSLIGYDKDLIQQPVPVTSITMGKWNRILRTGNLGASTSKGTGVNWPLMRYTDVLLMLAESENEISGPNGVAQEALKKVRQRAFPTSMWASKVDAYVSAVSAGKDQFFNAIVNERAWEFGGEFLRKYDLARWNLYGKKVAETINAMTQMGADAVAGVGAYSSLPDYLYFRRVGSEIIFLNKYTRLTTPPVLDPSTGVSRINWLRGLYNTTTNSAADYILRQYRGYQDPSGTKAVRYILPLHSSVIANSLGTLKNDGYGY